MGAISLLSSFKTIGGIESRPEALRGFKLSKSFSKVWSPVKMCGTRVPQKAIVPVGRPRPYSIIILNMRFISPKNHSKLLYT